MKPTKTLILGLRSAAQRLRDRKTHYNWYNPECCNLGILAQEILGLDEHGLKEINQAGCWTSSARREFCTMTGLPLTQIFTLLHAHGLEQDDYDRLEHLWVNDEGLSGDYTNPAAVANYFDQCAIELEERRKAGERP